jgi:putative ABC transport system substrate-binding protein
MTCGLALVAALIVGLVALPSAVEAQPSEKMAQIGLVAIGGDTSPRLEAFRQGLRELGYVEGRNIAIETRSGDASAARFSDDIARLVARKVDVIVATSTPAAHAARDATRTIPIVFVTAADPVGSGLVASIARPGGNVTGVSLLAPEMVARQVQLLSEAAPKTSRVTVLSNPSNTYHAIMVKELELAARTMAIGHACCPYRGPRTSTLCSQRSPRSVRTRSSW